MWAFGAGVDKIFYRNLVSGSVIYPGITCLAVAFEKALNDSAPVRGLNILRPWSQEAVNAGLMEIKADDPRPRRPLYIFCNHVGANFFISYLVFSPFFKGSTLPPAESRATLGKAPLP